MNKRPNIVFVAHAGGGPEVYVRMAACWMVDNGYSAHVLLVVQSKDTGCDDGGIRHIVPKNTHYYLSRIIGGYGGFAKLLRSRDIETSIIEAVDEIADREHVDCVECYDGVPVGRLSKRYRTAIKIQGAEWIVAYHINGRYGRHDKRYMKSYAKSIMNAHRVSALSKSVRDYVCDVCGIPPEIIRVIPYPISTPILRRQRSASRFRKVMYVGRIERRKGVHDLLHAMRVVHERRGEVQLDLVGGITDDGMHEYMEMSRTAGWCRYHGLQRNEIVRGMYGEVDVVVLPSYYETFGYTVLEAMAEGAAVVASSVGGICDIVADGVNGLLVPSGNPDVLASALMRVLDDDDLRGKLVASAYDILKNRYDIDVVMRQTMEYYLGNTAT